MLKILHNGKVYVHEGHFAQALLVDGHRIAMVGSNEEILSAASPVKGGFSGEIIDCGGRPVLPGFNDSHTHFIYWGRQMSEAKITDCHSIDDLVQRCACHLERNPDLSKKGLHALGWNQELFTRGEKRMPNRQDLDRISRQIPIVLERICAHIAVANTKAIELLGLDASSPQFEGGVFLREDSGFPNGIFCEKACEPLLDVLPPPSMTDYRGYFKAAMAHAVSMGLTSVQSNDIGAIGQDHMAILKMMDEVYTRGEGLLRYRHQVYCTSLSQFQERIQDGIFRRKENQDNMHVVGPLKLYKDGSLGGRTALMRRDYLDDPGNVGMEAVSRQELLSFCKMAADHNIQTVIHAIGDGAIQEVLDAFTLTMPPDNPMRNAIIHCQITDLPLLDRISENHILVQYQPIFLNRDLHILTSRVGSRMASTSYAFRTAIEEMKMGDLISFGTDAPVENADPFENIYAAVTRKDLSGYPLQGYYPKERVSVSQAVDAYTRGSAYGEFQEHQKGRLSPGYLADLIVLDRDIFSVPQEEIKDIKPILTMVDGNIVYSKNL
ncbi:MAG: amidohydrolase [Anaerovoracaceae bacterium]|jgi:predicted amidohydrolase YtcJ